MVRVCLIGAGNVAGHLGGAIQSLEGWEVVEVCSPHSARRLADELSCRAVTSPGDVTVDADLYLISVSDDALPSVVAALPRLPSAVYAHTSGSVGIEVLAPLGANTGVFYPLQTFSRDVELSLSRVPFFIEASSEKAERMLWKTAEAISEKVYAADSSLRRRLHIAAVFACNFVNHLWAIADGLLERDGLSLEVLYPLLEETLRKAERHHPADVQTGPAARGDIHLINSHAATLPDPLREVYLLLSQSIINSRQ